MLYKAPAVKPAFLCPLIREPRVLKISLRDLCVVSLKGLVNISTFGDLFPKLSLSDTTSLLFTLCSLQTIAFLIRDQSNVKLCLFGQSQLLVYWKQKKLIFCVCSKESNGFFFSFLMCFFFFFCCYRSVAQHNVKSEVLSYVDQLPVAEIIHQVCFKFKKKKKKPWETNRIKLNCLRAEQLWNCRDKLQVYEA